MSPSLPLLPMLTSLERRRLWAIPGPTCIQIPTSSLRSLNVPNAARQSSNGTGRQSMSTDPTAGVSFLSHTFPTSMGRKCLLGTRRSTKMEISCRTERTSSVRSTRSSKAAKVPRKIEGRNTRLPKGANATDRPTLLTNQGTSHHSPLCHTRTTTDVTTNTRNKGTGKEGGTEMGNPKEIQGILHQAPANSTGTQDHYRTIPTINLITNHLPRPLRTRHHSNNSHR